MLPFSLLRLAFCLRCRGSHARRHPHRVRRVVVTRDSRHGSSRQDPGPLVQQPAASDIPHTTDSGFNTTRLGHRLPTGTALSHAHGTTFIILAAMHRAASPTIPTEINKHNGSRPSNGYSNGCSTQARRSDSHSLSLPTSGSLSVRQPGKATA